MRVAHGRDCGDLLPPGLVALAQAHPLLLDAQTLRPVLHWGIACLTGLQAPLSLDQQLLAVWEGLAQAKATGRTLVLPDLVSPAGVTAPFTDLFQGLPDSLGPWTARDPRCTPPQTPSTPDVARSFTDCGVAEVCRVSARALLRTAAEGPRVFLECGWEHLRPTDTYAKEARRFQAQRLGGVYIAVDAALLTNCTGHARLSGLAQSAVRGLCDRPSSDAAAALAGVVRAQPGRQVLLSPAHAVPIDGASNIKTYDGPLKTSPFRGLLELWLQVEAADYVTSGGPSGYRTAVCYMRLARGRPCGDLVPHAMRMYAAAMGGCGHEGALGPAKPDAPLGRPPTAYPRQLCIMTDGLPQAALLHAIAIALVLAYRTSRTLIVPLLPATPVQRRALGKSTLQWDELFDLRRLSSDTPYHWTLTQSEQCLLLPVSRVQRRGQVDCSANSGLCACSAKALLAYGGNLYGLPCVWAHLRPRSQAHSGAGAGAAAPILPRHYTAVHVREGCSARTPPLGPLAAQSAPTTCLSSNASLAGLLNSTTGPVLLVSDDAPLDHLQRVAAAHSPRITVQSAVPDLWALTQATTFIAAPGTGLSTAACLLRVQQSRGCGDLLPEQVAQFVAPSGLCELHRHLRE